MNDVVLAVSVLVAIAAMLGAAALLFARARRRRATALAEAHRRLAMFVREVEAPALALLGLADRLPPEHGTAVAAEARRLLRAAADQTERQAETAGPRCLQPEPVALLPLLEEAVSATAAQLGGAQRQWRLAPDLAGLTLSADPRALRGALLPVLARAARTSREGDWIDVKREYTPDGVAIIVEDEGAGLGAEDLSRPDLAGPAAERTRGLDHGLATARALLEAHGGGLRLETLSGVGARAWLTLPRERVLTAPT